MAKQLLVLRACSSQGNFFFLEESGKPEQAYLAGMERAWDFPNPGGGYWTVLSRQAACCNNSWEPVMIDGTI